MDIKLKGLVIVGCLALGNAYAGTASTTFAVTANVQANCKIEADPLPFGAYDPTAATTTVVASKVTVTCTQGAGSFIGLNAGSNASTDGQRRMKATSGDTMLNYNLYQPTSTAAKAACPTTITSTTTTWGNTIDNGLKIGAAPTNAPRVYNVCGNIPAGQDVPLNTQYNDTVTATINF